MSIQINTISDIEFKVNDKLIFKDMNGNWICSEELTANEQKAFKVHLNSI
jgi:hypothetical protein